MEYLVRKQEKTKQFASLTIGELAGWKLSGACPRVVIRGSRRVYMYVGIMEVFGIAVPIFLQF